MSHVTHMNESCHTYKWAMSHIWMSHVTHMNESCHTYKWVMSHIWTSHVTHMNESCHTYKWRIPRVSKVHCHEMFVRVVFIVTKRVYVWHDSCICFTWIIRVCVLSNYSTHSSATSHITYLCNILLQHIANICTCDTIHAYVSHDLLVSVSWKFRTKSFLEWGGCRTRPLKTSGCQHQLTHVDEHQKVV